MELVDENQHVTPGLSPGDALLSLAREFWSAGDDVLAGALIDAAERCGAVTAKGLLWQAITQLKLGNSQNFWKLIRRASNMAPMDVEITATVETVEKALLTYTLDSQPREMQLDDAGAFIKRHPERGTSLELCQISENKVQRPLQVHELRDVFILGSEGVIVDIETSVVFKNSFSSMGHGEVSPATLSPGTRADIAKAVSVERKTAHLCGRWSGNFFHWMSELLPRALLLHRAGFDGFYMIPNCVHPFIVESLNMIGIPSEQVIANNPSMAIRCQSLFTFDSLWYAMYYENPSIMEDLVSLLLERVDTTLPLPDDARGIYIMRRGYRAVRNNEELRELLTACGVLCIYAEDYSFAEQVSLAARSRFLLGAHGSGLTLALFMPKQSTIVELVPADSFNCCYDYVSYVRQHRHLFVPTHPLAIETESGRVEPPLTVVKQILRKELGSCV